MSNLISTVELRRRTRIMQKIKGIIRAEAARRRQGIKGWNMGVLLNTAGRAKRYLKEEVRSVEQLLEKRTSP